MLAQLITAPSKSVLEDISWQLLLGRLEPFFNHFFHLGSLLQFGSGQSFLGLFLFASDLKKECGYQDPVA